MDAWVVHRNAAERERRRALVRGLAGARVHAVHARVVDPGIDDRAPRPFLYCASLAIRTDRGGLRLYGHEAEGDLVITTEDGAPDVDADDVVPFVRGTNVKLEEIALGADPSTGYIDSFVVKLDDGQRIVGFTGELDDIVDGKPIIRRGDEMLLLFRSAADADALGLELVLVEIA